MASAAASLVLSSNSAALAAECLRVSSVLLANLVRLDCPKHRSLNLSNPKIRASILNAHGGEALLLACGWEKKEGASAEMVGEDASSRAAAALAAIDHACSTHPTHPMPLSLSTRLPIEGVRACCAVGEGLVATGSMDNGNS